MLRAVQSWVAYHNGEGVAQDDAEAVRWWRLAAEQGNVSAQYKLGVAYDIGEGVAQDYAEAVRWYRLAAEQGNASAQYNLGVAYYFGEGVAQDYAEAVRWLRLAAEQGDARAQNTPLEILTILVKVLTKTTLRQSGGTVWRQNRAMPARRIV